MKYTTDRCFVDTNVLMYINSDFYAKKQKIGSDVLEALANNGNLWISTQVIQELFYNMTKISVVSREECIAIVRTYLKHNIVTNDEKVILSAIEIQEKNQLSFWDSLIVAAAARAKCKVLLTEDLNHGQKIAGVKIVNPFL